MSILDNEGHDPNGLGNRPRQLICEGCLRLLEVADENERLRMAIRWALGEAPDSEGKWFGDVPVREFRGKPAPFGWRTHLHKLAGLTDQ